MRLPIQPYEKTLYSPPTLLELPKTFGYPEPVRRHEEEQESIPDTNELTEQDSLYLIRQRVENLREEVGLSLDGIIELQELEAFIKSYEDDLEATPRDLGIPGKIDQLIAALEAKRVDRRDDNEYDGGDIDDEDEPLSNVNQHYCDLFGQSYLNIKSFSLLSPEKIPIRNGRKELKLFDLYETSLFSQVFHRCQDLARSPIYDDMQQIGDEHYKLAHDFELRFTSKTAIFTFPMSEFDDIERKIPYDNGKVGYIKASFVLPEYAHERKRFFRKGGTVKEMLEYLGGLGVQLPENWKEFLEKCSTLGVMHLYREVLELTDRDEVGGYFVNIRKGYHRISKGIIENSIIRKLGHEEKIRIRKVTPFSTWYPEWMRKIGGFIVEEANGKTITIPRPVRISVDDRLPKHIFRQARMLMPTNGLNHNLNHRTDWKELYLDELRKMYKKKLQTFRGYADALQSGKIQLHCACGSGGHEEHCPVPVLEEILGKISDSYIRQPDNE